MTETDSDIYQGILKRDELSVIRLYDRYDRILYGACYQILQSEEWAKDAVQEALVKIWERIDQYSPAKGKFFTWIYTLTRNTATDIRRSASFSNQAKNQTFDTPIHGQKGGVEENSVDPGLWKVFESLEDKYKGVLELVVIKGYTHQEASEILNIPLGTIKSRIRIGLNNLREKLRGDFPGLLTLLLMLKSLS